MRIIRDNKSKALFFKLFIKLLRITWHKIYSCLCPGHGGLQGVRTLHPLILTLSFGGWSALSSGRFTLGNKLRQPLHRRLGLAPEPVWTFRRRWKYIFSAGIRKSQRPTHSLQNMLAQIIKFDVKLNKNIHFRRFPKKIIFQENFQHLFETEWNIMESFSTETYLLLFYGCRTWSLPITIYTNLRFENKTFRARSGLQRNKVTWE